MDEDETLKQAQINLVLTADPGAGTVTIYRSAMTSTISSLEPHTFDVSRVKGAFDCVSASGAAVAIDATSFDANFGQCKWLGWDEVSKGVVPPAK